MPSVRPTELYMQSPGLGRDEFKLLRWGTSASDLEARLQSQGYTVISLTPYSFDDWLRAAATARDQALRVRAAGGKVDFEQHSHLWTSLKSHLFDLSNGYCGYCEAPVQTTSAGEVEHYRPKRRPTEDSSHPGYYWLAWDHENYVPCCTNCNTARGKRSQFPVAGTRALGPTDNLVDERPLLLNPFGENEAELSRHLEFLVDSSSPEFGSVRGTTDEGRTSVDVYNLFRVPLIEARRRALRNLEEVVAFRWQRQQTDGLVQELLDGRREFSAASLALIERWCQQETSKLRELELSIAARRSGGHS